MELLSISRSNEKLEKLSREIGRDVYTVSLPSGHTCPFARSCLAKVVDGKIVDGPAQEFRCFAASLEALRPNVHTAWSRNERLIREAYAEGGTPSVTKLIDLSLSAGIPTYEKGSPVVRMHVGGDFFALWYMRAWVAVAKRRPNVSFYAYTKALPFVKKLQATFPANFVLTASVGGTHDHLIDEINLGAAEVVRSRDEAAARQLAVDDSDRLAFTRTRRFALVIHGTQPSRRLAKARSLDVGSEDV